MVLGKFVSQSNDLLVDDRGAVEGGEGCIELSAKVGQHHGRRTRCGQGGAASVARACLDVT